MAREFGRPCTIAITASMMLLCNVGNQSPLITHVSFLIECTPFVSFKMSKHYTVAATDSSQLSFASPR